MSTGESMPQFTTIKVAVEDGGLIGRLTLNRPERLNAIGATMLRELAEAAHWFDAHGDLRVVIVSGEGRSFCAGADLKDSPMAESAEGGPRSWVARRERGQLGLRMADAIEQMHALTIAKIRGHAIGGGVVLAAACDLRVCAEDAVFSIPEIELGIPLAWGGIPRLVREIGPALTKELVITCRPFSPAEAMRAGFVNRVVPAAHLDSAVESLACEIMSKPAVPVAITKEHVNAVSRAMAAGLTAFADGDALMAALAAPESTVAFRAYGEKLASQRGKKKS